MKFGGTSVAGTGGMRRVAGIVAAARDRRPVVVTSAMAGVTDALAGLLETALQGGAIEEGVAAVRDRHLAVAMELAPSDAGLRGRLEALCRELRVLLRGIRLLGTTTARSADAVLGFGELLAQELLVAALAAGGVPGRVVDAREVIVTDDGFGAARPDLAATRARCAERVVPVVEAGEAPVLGGYLGGTPEGVPTTLGRGGSDLSAAVLGLALGAERVEIWTDVDGLLSGDPRVVPGARVIPEISFREASELAFFGARVLHPASIDPAIQGGLPVHVRNSLSPDRPGTVILPAPRAPRAAAVALRRNLALVRLRAPGWRRRRGFLGDLARRIAGHGVELVHAWPGPLGIELLVPGGRAAGTLDALLAEDGERRAETGLVLVSLVGEVLARRPALWGEALALAGERGALRVVQGEGAISLGVLVPADRAEELARAWHGRFVEEERTDGH